MALIDKTEKDTFYDSTYFADTRPDTTTHMRYCLKKDPCSRERLFHEIDEYLLFVEMSLKNWTEKKEFVDFRKILSLLLFLNVFLIRVVFYTSICTFHTIINKHIIKQY